MFIGAGRQGSRQGDTHTHKRVSCPGSREREGMYCTLYVYVTYVSTACCISPGVPPGLRHVWRGGEDADRQGPVSGAAHPVVPAGEPARDRPTLRGGHAGLHPGLRRPAGLPLAHPDTSSSNTSSCYTASSSTSSFIIINTINTFLSGSCSTSSSSSSGSPASTGGVSHALTS